MMRKALAELKLWGLQREFELSETTSQVWGVKGSAAEGSVPLRLLFHVTYPPLSSL